MAKVRGPLYSIDARGAVASSMVYGGWKGIKWCRGWVLPQNPKTVLQVKVREIMAEGVLRWQGFAAGRKTGWETGSERTGKAQSGFNYFMSNYISDMWAGVNPPDDSPL